MAGDICGTYSAFDGSRVQIEMNERSVAIDYEDLHPITNRVSVGSGLEKPAANIEAASSNLINVLIADEETAGRMTDFLDNENSGDSSRNTRT